MKTLLVADDLTGGADAGVKFAKIGLRTLLVPFHRGDFPHTAKQTTQDVLVINTMTRGLPATEASNILSDFFVGYEPKRFPLLYKKIDSTLRGNIGSEIDIILRQTDRPLCFLAPSYPEQSRVLIGGIMLVRERPLALTETALDTLSPVRESHVHKLLASQTTLPLGTVDITIVASGKQGLRKAVDNERRAGRKIIIFDAMKRQDLSTIAKVALSMEPIPILAGSAGLAEEVARLISAEKVTKISERRHSFRHILIIGGSTSSVTRAQLQRLCGEGLPSFELTKDFVSDDNETKMAKMQKLAHRIGTALIKGSTILRPFAERCSADSVWGANIPQRITEMIADVAVKALAESQLNKDELALILTGGDTAMCVLHMLDYKGIELCREPIEGIVQGKLQGGPCDGLTVITKAGGFGKENALLKVVEGLQGGQI